MIMAGRLYAAPCWHITVLCQSVRDHLAQINPLSSFVLPVILFEK